MTQPFPSTRCKRFSICVGKRNWPGPAFGNGEGRPRVKRPRNTVRQISLFLRVGPRLMNRGPISTGLTARDHERPKSAQWLLLPAASPRRAVVWSLRWSRGGASGYYGDSALAISDPPGYEGAILFRFYPPWPPEPAS